MASARVFRLGKTMIIEIILSCPQSVWATRSVILLLCIYLLDTGDMKLVSDALKESHFIDANWFDLGVELHLPYPQLKNIEDSYVNNPSRCLRECLSLWLTSANNRTWESLASALERMNQKPAATLIRNTCKVNIHTYLHYICQST